jgi:hypothetical protein
VCAKQIRLDLLQTRGPSKHWQPLNPWANKGFLNACVAKQFQQYINFSFTDKLKEHNITNFRQKLKLTRSVLFAFWLERFFLVNGNRCFIRLFFLSYFDEVKEELVQE